MQKPFLTREPSIPQHCQGHTHPCPQVPPAHGVNGDRIGSSIASPFLCFIRPAAGIRTCSRDQNLYQGPEPAAGRDQNQLQGSEPAAGLLVFNKSQFRTRSSDIPSCSPPFLMASPEMEAGASLPSHHFSFLFASAFSDTGRSGEGRARHRNIG